MIATATISRSGSPQTIRLNDDELRLFQDFMYREAGIRLPDAKRNLIQARLQDRLREKGCQSFFEYYQLISQEQQKAERTWCIEQLTTNETFFFRHKEHWDFIADKIVPHHIQHGRGRPFKAWSAACSTGEEPYSLSMLLSECFRDKNSFQITASDLNRQVIQIAQRALYEDYSLQKVTDLCRQRYFISQAGGLQVHNDIRRHIRFQVHNLTSPSSIKSMDLIMVRNVLIYFDKKSKQEAIDHLAKSLRPGGWLILGGAESMGVTPPTFHYLAPAIYQRTDVEVK